MVLLMTPGTSTDTHTYLYAWNESGTTVKFQFSNNLSQISCRWHQASSHAQYHPQNWNDYRLYKDMTDDVILGEDGTKDQYDDTHEVVTEFGPLFADLFNAGQLPAMDTVQIELRKTDDELKFWIIGAKHRDDCNYIVAYQCEEIETVFFEDEEFAMAYYETYLPQFIHKIFISKRDESASGIGDAKFIDQVGQVAERLFDLT